MTQKGIMYANSIVATSVDDVLQRISALPPGTATLAIVFASEMADLDGLARGLASHGCHVFGCSSAGEFVGDNVLSDSISVLLLGPPPGSFDVRLFDANPEAGPAIGAWLHERFPQPMAMMHLCGRHVDGEALMRAIQQAAGQDIPLFGGSAGTSQELFSDTFVFDGTGVRSNAVAVLALDGSRLSLDGFAVSGWASVGMPKTVTAAKGNVVYSFDGQPALDVYERYLPFREMGAWVGVNYPLQVSRPDGSVVLRGAYLFDETDKSVTFFASVPEGSQVKFSVPPGTDITEAAIAVAEEQKERLAPPSAIIAYSCLARRLALGPGAEDEIARLSKVWPNVPLAGGFTFSEIGSAPGKGCDFHNHTMVVTLLGVRP